ncbi:nitroreductase family protein [Alkalihalobacillus sp. NPDC078783]
MKSIAKKYLPKFLFTKGKRLTMISQLRSNYQKDLKRYYTHSYELTESKTKRHMETDLIFFYHKIEKGLSLPNPRVGFGEKAVRHLVEKLDNYVSEYGWDRTAQICLNSLYSYYDFNKENDLILDKLYSELENLKDMSKFKNNQITAGGVTNLTKEDIENANVNFKDFALARHSLRNFSPGEVSLESIKDCVKIAQKTPSVCNRQSTKVYVYEGEEMKNVLNHQNGNAGFGFGANKVLIITVNLEDFRGPKERNQAYIDGGLFSMSLIYAFHSLIIGTCALNLSLNYDDELRLKKEAKIPNSEVTIMMIAVGNYPDTFKVADSPRRNLEEVLVIN